MKYKAVLFDMDGVIVDSEPLHVAAFKQTLKQYGYTLTDTAYRQYFAGHTDREGYQNYFAAKHITTDVEMIVTATASTFKSMARGHIKPLPGVVPLIKQLHSKVKLAVVTGSVRPEAELALQECGLQQYFDVIVTGDDVKHGKPSPEGFLQAAYKLRVAVEDCVIVEDSPPGLQAAQAANIAAIAVTNTHSAKELAGATKIVDQLTLEAFEN